MIAYQIHLLLKNSRLGIADFYHYFCDMLNIAANTCSIVTALAAQCDLLLKAETAMIGGIVAASFIQVHVAGPSYLGAAACLGKGGDKNLLLWATQLSFWADHSGASLPLEVWSLGCTGLHQNQPLELAAHHIGCVWLLR